MEINGIKMLFDAGKTYKYISSSLLSINVDIKDIDYIFITHTHSDHISALKDILKKSNAKLCISQKMFYELDKLKDFDRLIIFEDELVLDEISIMALNSSHDTPTSKNYVVSYNNHKISYITDTGYVKQKHFKNFYDSNIIFMESNHDIELLENGKYPSWLKKRVISDVGHLSNSQAGFYLSKIIGPKTKNILLIHLSAENNDPNIAINTVENILNEYEIEYNNILYAKQNEISEVFTI